MRVGAGIYQYRHWPDVRKTIDSLIAQTRRPDEIVVFDHASGDGSAQHIRDAYPEVEVVEAPDNRGQAAGENRTRRLLVERGFDAVYVSPDDLELAPDALERLVARLEEAPEVGAVGPLIGRPEERDRVFYAGGYVNRHNWSLEFRDDPPGVSDWRGCPPQVVDFLQTGGMLMRVEVAEQVGGLDERFWYWAEDVDYTLRIGRAGWRVECLPDAVGWQSFGRPAPYIKTRNRLLLIKNNASKRIVARELARQLYLLGLDAVKREDAVRNDLRPRLRAITDFCLGRWGAPPESVAASERSNVAI